MKNVIENCVAIEDDNHIHDYDKEKTSLFATASIFATIASLYICSSLLSSAYFLRR